MTAERIALDAADAAYIDASRRWRDALDASRASTRELALAQAAIANARYDVDIALTRLREAEARPLIDDTTS